MMKKLLLPILALYLFTHSVGCTSSDAQEESDVAVSDDESFSNEAEEDFADGSESSEESSDEGGEESGDEVAEGDSEGETSEGEASEETSDVAENEGEGDGGEELEGDESLEGGEEVAASEGEPVEGDEDSEFPEDVADETESMGDTAVAENEAAPSDENLFTGDTASATETPPAEEPPPAEAPVETAEAVPQEPADDLFKSTPRVATAATFAPLQKIKDAPFERGGGLLNRVYLARPGDKLKDVSQKIYGSDRTQDLQKWNPGVRRNLRTGDKVYYNSPTEPQDSTRLLTYFEDKGIPPQVHVTKDGDNIRALGKDLLGNGDSWKELWSTNLDVASKGALPAGVELRYWPETASAAAATAPPPGTVAGVDPMAPPPADPTAPPMADPTAPMPPDNGLAQNGAPPADPTAMPPLDDPTAMPPGDMAAADPLGAPPTNSPETAPPPIANTESIAPAMPEADPVKKKAPATAEVASADDTTIMIGIAGIALLLLVGVVVIMKKNRSRRIDLSQTQV